MVSGEVSGDPYPLLTLSGGWGTPSPCCYPPWGALGTPSHMVSGPGGGSGGTPPHGACSWGPPPGDALS